MKNRSVARGCLLGLMVLMMAALIACTKVSRANFEKIEEGMPMDAVVQILGEPTDASEIDLKFVSGGAARWEDEKAGRAITVQFLNGKVKFKQFEDLSE